MITSVVLSYGATYIVTSARGIFDTIMNLILFMYNVDFIRIEFIACMWRPIPTMSFHTSLSVTTVLNGFT